ncbi:MAG: CHASE2 domain-containing protein [Nitrospirae bacterium]|nr:MAG: CHASE2 domain-containing protein [Nitrospirota bacterium]
MLKRLGQQGFLAVLVIGVLACAVGWGVNWVAPSWKLALSDWRITHRPWPSVDPRIVLVPVEEHDTLVCGAGQWHRLELATVISSMAQADALGIGPLAPMSGVPPPECGDVVGEVRLAEATKLAGSVIYPDTVSDSLKDAARAVGVLEIPSDRDGVIRRVSGDDSHRHALGLVMGSVVMGQQVSFPSRPSLIPFVGAWSQQPFRQIPYSTLHASIEQRDIETLTRLVGGKIVLLFPVSSSGVATPVDSRAPLGFVHATILNAALTDAWLLPMPWWMAISVTLLFAIGMSWLICLGPSPWKWPGIGMAGLVYLFMAHAAWVFGQRVVPIVPMSIALVASVVGGSLWARFAAYHHTRYQWERAQAHLARLGDELRAKEALVHERDLELRALQKKARESAEQLDSLSAAEAQARSKLQAARTEVADTQERIRQLEAVVQTLQAHAPVPEPRPEIPSRSDGEHHEAWDDLRQECESLGIVTRNPALLALFGDLKKAAATQNPVLLLGETGTGKELFARAVHTLSPRKDGPFVPVNMAAIRGELFEGELFGHVKGAFTGAVGRRGLLETASGGTVFLDEIGELGLDVQAKLLRVLDSGAFYRVGASTLTQVDVRIVAATNRDLDVEVREGRFREDLYYRLRSLVFRLPPLRERGPDDILALAHRIVTESCDERGMPTLEFSLSATQAMIHHPWPGNIRELRQVLIQAVTMCEGRLITESDLRLDTRSQAMAHLNSSRGATLDFLKGKVGHAWREDEAVLACLRRHRFDMQRTARELGWDRSTVTQRLKGLGFQALVECDGDLHAAAALLAGDPGLIEIVKSRLREYTKNLLPPHSSHMIDQAIADCRKRFRNLPERYFPAVEALIRRQFAEQSAAINTRTAHAGRKVNAAELMQ